MKVVISIDGRQAVPVRAIPYVGDWQADVWPADIAHACATPLTTNRIVKVGNDKIALGPVGTQRLLIAFVLDGSIPRPMLHSEWERIAERLRAMPVETDADIRCALEALPERAFVWLDELQRYFSLTRPLNFNPERPDENIVGFEDQDLDDEDRERVDTDKSPVPIYALKPDTLNLDPHLPEGVALVVATTLDALRQMPDMTGWASWRSALLQRWEDIREYYQKEPNGRDAIVWAVKCGPSVFVRDQTVSNDFQWLDADGEVQKTGIHQAQNAVADWRKRGFIPSPK